MDQCEVFPGSLRFIILSPDPNIARLKDTVRSISSSFRDEYKPLCVVGSSTKKKQLEEMNEVCPTYKGGDTVTSLINEGFKNSEGEGWRMLVLEGARVPFGVIRRYSTWIRSDRDVLFPICVNQDMEGRPVKVIANFEECTLNGVLIHSRMFRDAGNFSDNPFNVSKSFWAIGALEHGAVFKAILGVKII